MGKKFSDILANNLFMIKLVWKYKKMYFLVFLALILITDAKEFVLIVAPKYIFDSMQYGEELTDVFMPVFVYISLYFITNILLHFFSYIKTIYEVQIKMNLNVCLGEKFMKVDYSFLESNKSIEMFNRARLAISGGLNDIQTLGMVGEQGITGYFEQMKNIITNVFLLGGVLYIFTYLDWITCFIICVCVILSFLFSINKTKANVQVREKAGPYLSKSRYCNHLLRTFEYGKEFRTFNMSDFIVNKLRECIKEYVDVRNGAKKRSCYSDALSHLASNALRIVVLIFLIYQLADEKISVGVFSMVFAAAVTFSEAINNLLLSILSMNILASFMRDFQSCMELREDSSTDDKIELSEGMHQIEFRSVWFKYENAPDYALKDINLFFSTSEKISIVGFNGAGKSTFIKLLLGLYSPTSGDILIDGKSMKEYSLESVRRYISAVFQDYKIFALSIEQNISLAETVEKEKFETCIERAEIKDKMEQLEKKEKSVVGGFFDDGDILLSGGEYQKIAMARSFYRNTHVIALDEPTSALDVLSEDRMYKSVAKNSHGELLFFISHRLASTKFCDYILVFADGKIIEKGTHDSLMQQKGTYYHMWTIQAEKFDGE